ncbi:MAG: hypothetical protein ACOYOL_12460 [Chthoniobacterales bacterium]
MSTALLPAPISRNRRVEIIVRLHTIARRIGRDLVAHRVGQNIHVLRPCKSGYLVHAPMLHPAWLEHCPVGLCDDGTMIAIDPNDDDIVETGIDTWKTMAELCPITMTYDQAPEALKSEFWASALGWDVMGGLPDERECREYWPDWADKNRELIAEGLYQEAARIKAEVEKLAAQLKTVQACAMSLQGLGKAIKKVAA